MSERFVNSASNIIEIASLRRVAAESVEIQSRAYGA